MSVIARASAARLPARRSFVSLPISTGELFGRVMPWFTTAKRRRREEALLRRLAVSQPRVELVDQLFRGIGDHGAGREDCLGAGLVEFVVIFRRHSYPHDD